MNTGWPAGLPAAPPGPRVVGREEWQAARARLAAVEDEIARAREVLALARRGLPAVRVDGTYRFDGPAATDLPGLFAGRRQLVVVHLMYPAGAGGLCAGCTVVADGIAGLGHLRSRDTELVAVSRGPAEALAGARTRRGWTFPWFSCADGFARDFGFLAGAKERPGLAVFLRDGADVLHTYSAHGRGVEQVMNAYAWLDLTPFGRQDPAG